VDKVLTSLNDDTLNQISLSKQESFWFTGANNTKVEGFLIKPPNFDPSKKYPVKFLIHGGPQGAWGDAWSYRWNPELFAANGYVVVMINPRGSTGYGQRFLEEVSGDWGGRPYVDLMKGLDYAEQHYSFIDKNRECALGASYGGYMADWVLTHTNRFKCIVTHDGMSDPAAAFGDTEELWFMEWEFRPLAPSTNLGAPSVPAKPGRVGPQDVVEQTKPSHPWDFYNTPDSANPYIKWSPMRFIKDAHTPTLIVHSQRDMRLDVSQGLELFTALQLLGVPSKMLYFPDEGHWVLKPQNSQLWYSTVSDWCDRWLGMNKYASTGPEHNPAAAASPQH
jgi:dipeptidyl aminopeptidase/acylaminoacyl peptidase